MELTIKNITSKRRQIQEKEREVINRAMISFQVVMSRYEKYTDIMKRDEKMQLAQENVQTELDKINPFNIGTTVKDSSEPSIDEVKEFVYSSWAEAVANVQTPYICDAATRKGIRKKAFRDVQNGKYISNKVRTMINDTVKRMTTTETTVEEKQENDK